MNKILLTAGVLSLAAVGAFAQVRTAHIGVLCDTCGTVQQVQQQEQKAKTSGVGMVGGAVLGGVLGNQLGGGTGKALATIGGAAAGGYLGNKVEERRNTKVVWVTTVKMKDGSIRSFQQEAKPFWTAGTKVKVNGENLENP